MDENTESNEDSESESTDSIRPSTEERIAMAKKQWETMKFFSGMMPDTGQEEDSVASDDPE